MEQRDYILREIEKISVVILAILGKFKKIKSKKQFEDERSMIDSELKDSTGLTIESLLSVPEEDLISYLAGRKDFDTGNMELLAGLLVAFEANMDRDEGRTLLKKAIGILEYIDRETRTFSMERSMKINELKAKLR
ncbi:MAG: hypothetical protein V2I34_12880 [Bacteroidales bacterium]|jgi:hypothetical protein|nr:hypothetical protein [Bacteroidales bacterium]